MRRSNGRQVASTECLLRVQHYFAHARTLAHEERANAPLYRRENQGSERLSNLSQITQLVNSRAESYAEQILLPLKLTSLHSTVELLTQYETWR